MLRCCLNWPNCTQPHFNETSGICVHTHTHSHVRLFNDNSDDRVVQLVRRFQKRVMQWQLDHNRIVRCFVLVQASLIHVHCGNKSCDSGTPYDACNTYMLYLSIMFLSWGGSSLLELLDTQSAVEFVTEQRCRGAC